MGWKDTLFEIFEEDIPEVIASYREQALEQGLEQGIERGRVQGLEQGLERGKEIIARKLKEMGDPIEKIQTITGLSFETIEQM